MVQNKGLIFKSAPSGWPVEGENLVIEARDFDVNAQPPEDGLTTKNLYFSFDPYLRGRMRASQSKLYLSPYTLGQPIPNHAVAQVLKSGILKFKDGDIVLGMLPIEEYFEWFRVS